MRMSKENRRLFSGINRRHTSPKTWKLSGKMRAQLFKRLWNVLIPITVWLNSYGSSENKSFVLKRCSWYFGIKTYFWLFESQFSCSTLLHVHKYAHRRLTLTFCWVHPNDFVNTQLSTKVKTGTVWLNTAKWPEPGWTWTSRPGDQR